MRPSHEAPPRAGFTLVELVVVLVVLGVALAVAAPGMRPPAHGARSVAARLADVAAAARSTAAARGGVVTVTIELASGAYVVVERRSPYRAADTLRSGVLALPPGARLEGGRDGWAELTFHPLGHVRADPLAVVGAGPPHEIVVSPFTASVATRAR